MSSIPKFLSEARDELKKVVWPTRHELIKLSAIVIGAAFVLGCYLGLLDAVFSYGVRLLIK